MGMRGEMFSAAYIVHAEEALARFWISENRSKAIPPSMSQRSAAISCARFALESGSKPTVRVSKIGGRSAGFSILMHRGAEHVAEAEIIWSACDRQSGAPAPLSEELRDWLYRFLD